MKVHILDLNPDLDVSIAGDEDWLAPIYGDFPLPDDCKTEPAKIVGQAKVQKITDDVVRVTGQLKYEPQVSCSRCVKAIAWTLEESFDVYFQRRGQTELPKDVTLRKGELDEYYFEAEEIDVGEVINDTIQTALPTRFLPEAVDGSACKICGIDLEPDHVFGTPASEDDKDHPFAALKGLKTKN